MISLPVWDFRDTFSTHDEMRVVLGKMLNDVKNCIDIDEEWWYDLKIILHELCCNALDHGKEPVEVFAAICECDNRLHILVCDNGTGFNPAKNKPAGDKNAESGRGLHIISCLADDIIFSSTASRVLVRMRF